MRVAHVKKQNECVIYLVDDGEYRHMENPAYWTEATRVIQKALEDYKEGIRQGVIGASQAWFIQQRLIRAGMLKEDQ
jgi:hypothetical protein